MQAPPRPAAAAVGASQQEAACSAAAAAALALLHDEPPPSPSPDEQQRAAGVVRAGVLLRLPEPLEAQFWQDGGIMRSYANSDKITAGYTLLGIVLVVRQLAPVLLTRTPLPGTWDVRLMMVLNVMSCVATLVALLGGSRRLHAAYTRHRDAIALGHRLLRLAGVVLMCVRRKSAAQAALGSAASAAPLWLRDRSPAVLALLHLTRPLNVWSMGFTGQGVLNMRAQWWVPLQVASFLLTFFGVLRHQPCRLANNPHAAAILQPAVAGISRVHQLVLSLVMGPHLMALDTSPPDVFTAARVISCFHLAGCMLFCFAGSVFDVEFRLKSRWVLATHGKQLVYGPCAWLSSSDKGRCEAGDGNSNSCWLVRATAYVVLVPSVLWLLWLVCLTLVPLLPAPACDVKPVVPLEPCDTILSADPGLIAGAVIYIQILALFVLVGACRNRVLCRPWGHGGP